jgi:serralysin
MPINSNQPQSSDVEIMPSRKELTIAEVVSQSDGEYDDNSQDFDILLNAVKQTDLVSALSDKNADFTVFAPTDEAFLKLSRFFGYTGNDESAVIDVINKEFAKLNQTELDNGASNSEAFKLRDVILYHLVEGTKPLAEIKSLTGEQRILESVLFDTSPGVSDPESINFGLRYIDGNIEDASPNLVDPKIVVELADLPASNGVIHGIDRVLFPFYLLLTPPATIADVLAESGRGFDTDNQDFDILNQLLRTAEMREVFADPDANLTLFAPTDAAFIKLDNLLSGYEADFEDPSSPAESRESSAYVEFVNFLSMIEQMKGSLPSGSTGNVVARLQDVLKYHVSAGTQTAEDIQSATAPINTLLEGATIRSEDGKLVDQSPDFADPQLQTGKTDITASNGVIQTIDNLLLPQLLPSAPPGAAPPAAPPLAPEPASELTIAEIVAQSGGEFDDNNQDFDILLNALKDAGLTQAVADPTADLTVFAPTDAAFIQLANDFGVEGNDEGKALDAIVAELTELGNGQPIPILQEVLKYHVSAGAKTLAEIKESPSVSTLLDGISITPDGDKLVDQDPNFGPPGFQSELTDIAASNGIIQAIDSVLLPRTFPKNDIPKEEHKDCGSGLPKKAPEKQPSEGNDDILGERKDDLPKVGQAADSIIGNGQPEVPQGDNKDDLLFGGTKTGMMGNDGASKEILSGPMNGSSMFDRWEGGEPLFRNDGFDLGKTTSGISDGSRLNSFDGMQSKAASAMMGRPEILAETAGIPMTNSNAENIFV